MAIEPTDNVLLAPADGSVSVVMEESNHAVGLSLPNGTEILLHIGLDTVAMNGDGFQSFVKMGEKVREGQELIRFDPEKIRAAGHPLITVLVVTEGPELSFETGKEVRAGKDEIARSV